MHDHRDERSAADGFRALQACIGGFAKSFHHSCNCAAQNASQLVNVVHSQRLHLMNRTAPFAAANLQFARAADPKGKGKKRRKEAGKTAGKDSPSVAESEGSQPDRRQEVQKEKPSQDSREVPEAQQQKARQAEAEKRKEERRLANERKRQEAESRRRAADEKRQQVKRQEEEAQKKQMEAKRREEEKEAKRQEKELERAERAEQKEVFREAKRLLRQQFGESAFVRSLDEVIFEEGELDEYRTLTGLHPVTKDELNEAHDELMREVMEDTGDYSLEDKSLSQLLDDAEKEKKRAEMSADEPGIRKKLREQIYDEMSGDELRAHAPKMQLKDSEHDALELDRFGQGFFFHPKKLLGLVPWGVVHDLSWGMFGRIPVVQERLGPKWGGEDPTIVLQRQDYYDDILNIAPEMEMTVMVVAERDIPLAELRNKMLDMQHIRLRQVMYREEHLKPLSRKHRVLLAKLKHSVMEDPMHESGLVDSKGNIKKDSKLVLVVTEDGALTAEGITPGTVSQQKVVRLGRWTDTTFARSVMDNFLGLFPADNMGKNAVGNGVLYAANGFDFRAPEISGNPYQLYDSPPSKDVPAYLSNPTEQEGVVYSPEIFKIEGQHPFIVEDLSKAIKKSEPILQAAG